MAAPTLRRALAAASPPGPRWGAPALGGGRGQARAGGSLPPEQAPEQARLRAREHKERRLRQRRDRAAQGAGGNRVPPSPLLGWTPQAELEYEHPLGPDGKKATGVPLPPSYSPRYVEAAWYSWWESLGVFSPPKTPPGGSGGGRVLSMVLPPPNVTGSLHLGHGLTVALQDVLVRWRRMQGWEVLWLPGTDHAGIATQAVVERWLWQRRGLRRQDLSRPQFLQEVWAWKERHGEQILGQLRALGASLDWSRLSFTMDPGFSRAVTEAFVRLHRAGLIRRQQRLVSWSCALRSAVADIEVESLSLPGPTRLRVPGCPQPVTFGLLFTFAYPVEGDDGLELPVATTRPETLLGDVAVAVHPEDPRYTHLHGRFLRQPFTNRLLPIVCDRSVQPQLGTGAVKVTPGHSRPDLALALAHGLPLLSVIGEDGTVQPPGGGWLQGVQRFAAREQLLAALAELGLLRGCQDHAMALPLCSRSGDVIEQLLKEQWFLSCQGMARRAQQAVASGRLQLVPKFHEKSWRSWMENMGDWCLSRQLWWGHQIPAYWVGVPPALAQEGSPTLQGVPLSPPPRPPAEGGSLRGGLWVVERSEAEARARGAQLLGCPPQEVQLLQDPDVLDTWFSSSLFPFASLGWPQQTPDLQRFYPTRLLGTGSDLLFFWVARMVMLAQELTGQLPFTQVLLHSLLRDPQGRKMSKSLGNSLDPLDLIRGAPLQDLQQKLQERILDPRLLQEAKEAQRLQFPQGLPELGSDSLRLALCSHNAHGAELQLELAAALRFRRFCNKVWNCLRYVLAALQRLPRPRTHPQVLPGHPLSRWVLSRLLQAVGEVNRRLEALEVHAALAAVHHFWLRTFCDVYLEVSKGLLRDPQVADETLSTLLSCSDLGLRLLAPFSPFLAEELWQRLPKTPQDPPTICLASFPDPQSLAHWHCPEVEAQVEAMMEVVKAARGLRDTLRLGAARLPLAVQCLAEDSDWLAALGPSLQTLARAGSLQLLPPGAEPELGPGWVEASAGPGTRIWLSLGGLQDPEATRGQLLARSRSLQRQLQGLGGDPKTPPDPHQVASLQSELSRLAQALKAFDPPGAPGPLPK